MVAEVEPISQVSQKNLLADFFAFQRLNHAAYYKEAMQVLQDSSKLDPVPKRVAELQRVEQLIHIVLK